MALDKLEELRTYFRNWVKKRLYLYDISDLTIGGNCGCCGKWVDKIIVEKGYEWTICEECANAE